LTVSLTMLEWAWAQPIDRRALAVRMVAYSLKRRGLGLGALK
jgi:hypothetical protein